MSLPAVERVHRLETQTADPLGYRIDLQHRATLFPMGYPVTISSNSPAPLQIAQQLWRAYPRLFDATPVELRVLVNETDHAILAIPAPPRGHGHLVTVVHGPQDFGVADLSQGFGFAMLSPAALEHPGYFRYFFLEPLVYLMQAARQFVFVHASCIARNRNAIVLCGESGAGKTCLAYACAKRGWSLVTGDALHIVRDDDTQTVIGRPYEMRFRESACHLFPELREFPGELRPNGKADVTVEPKRMGIATDVCATARAVVFLDRCGPPGLRRYNREAALQQLGKTICFGDDELRHAQTHALQRFVSLPLWQLNVSDLDQAERLLAALPDIDRTC